MSRILEIDNVTKSFNENTSPVIDSLSLHCNKGEFLVILGATGCGKSTLLRMIAGLEKEFDGTIRYKGEHISNSNEPIGVVFQHSTLFPWLTVEKNVAFSLKMQKVPKQERLKKARELISLVGLEGCEKMFPFQLSGGMRMRTSLARTLAHNADLILMDEPFSALDEETRKIMQDELLQIWKNQHKTIIFVTHNRSEAERLATRTITLS